MTDNELRLEAYIEAEFQSIAENNSCEHRPTMQSQVDAAEERIRRLYDRGLKLQEAIGEEDLLRCLRMYNLYNRFGGHSLVEARVLDSWVVVPHYVELITKMRELREAIL